MMPMWVCVTGEKGARFSHVLMPSGYVSPEDRVGGPLCCYPKIHPPIAGRLEWETPQEAKVLWVSPVCISDGRRRELNRFFLR